MNVQDREILDRMRKEIFITGYSGGMAHLASCFSAVEIIYTLYMKVMKYDPKMPDKPDRDRFVLSKGHGALALYAAMCEAGYLSYEELHTYLKPGCHIGGEPNMRDLRGIEASTGSLGHGLSLAVGMAIAQNLDQNGARTFVLVGDGECQEGSIWEAAISAAAFRLNNLIGILDCNRVQKTKYVEDMMGYVHWEEKWKAFGWNVLETDGHDIDALQNTLGSIPQNGKPTMIIAHTVKGKGVSIMENNLIWHFRIPNRREKKVFMEELHIREEELEV